GSAWRRVKPPAPADDRKSFRVPCHPLEDPNIRIHPFAFEKRLRPLVLDLIGLSRDRFAAAGLPTLGKTIGLRLRKILDDEDRSAACHRRLTHPGTGNRAGKS